MTSKPFKISQIKSSRGIQVRLCASVSCNVSRYLNNLLKGTTEPRDRAEVNDRWATGVRLFVATTLTRIHNDEPILDDVWNLWVEIARRTFASGAYDPEAEIVAHRELTGATVKDSYLVLSNKYTLVLISSRPNRLPQDIASPNPGNLIRLHPRDRYCWYARQRI